MSKKEPISLHHKPDTRLCLSCGFPNRASDRLCMYCKASLFEETSFLSWIRQTYLILRWRWQIKERYNKANGFSQSYLPILKILGYFFVGVLLFTLGLYFFSTGLTENSFSSGLIGMLFLFYGFFTLKSVFIRK
jgi:hypothetical protein